MSDVNVSGGGSGIGGSIVGIIVVGIFLVGGFLMFKYHPIISLIIVGVVLILLILFIVWLVKAIKKSNKEAENSNVIRASSSVNTQKKNMNPYTFKTETTEERAAKRAAWEADQKEKRESIDNQLREMKERREKEAEEMKNWKPKITYRVCGYCQRAMSDNDLKCAFCGADVTDSVIVEREDDNHDDYEKLAEQLTEMNKNNR